MRKSQQTEVISDMLINKDLGHTPLLKRRNKKPPVNVNSTALSNDVIHSKNYLFLPDANDETYTHVISSLSLDILRLNYVDYYYEPYENISDADSTSNDRITLLARKYEDEKFTKEDNARLTILSERLRKRFPRVKEEDYSLLNSLVDEADNFSDFSTDLRKKYE